MTEKIIYTRWVAYELKKQGYPIIRVEINPNKPQFDCYVFEATDGFYKALKTITDKH